VTGTAVGIGAMTGTDLPIAALASAKGIDMSRFPSPPMQTETKRCRIDAIPAYRSGTDVALHRRAGAALKLDDPIRPTAMRHLLLKVAER
jgi:hypothetical protein